MSTRLRTLTGIRVATLLVLGLTSTACHSDRVSTEPDLSPAFAKPATQTAVPSTFTFLAGNLTNDGAGTYAEGVCGVVARVFYLAPNYLDGNLQLNNPRAKDRNCAVRKLSVTYPDNGQVQSNSGSMNVGSMGTVTSTTGPGLRSMNVAIAGNTARCTRLGFGNAIGGSQVVVTRVNATTWNVTSQLGGSAACEKPDGSIEMIANFTVNFDVALN